MESNKIFQMIVTAMILVSILIGGCIAYNLMQLKWTKELIQTSLEKGQNPMYVKCAMESSHTNECKTLVTALAVGKADK